MIRVVVLWLALAGAAFAVEPDEMLPDPALEERAREISKGLRCLVCRNESIDESDAGLAKDLRLLVRERLVAGDSDAQVLDFVVARYGEYVLLSPRASGSTLILWLAGPFMLIMAAMVAFFYLRSRSPVVATAELSEDEKSRLEEIAGR